MVKYFFKILMICSLVISNALAGESSSKIPSNQEVLEFGKKISDCVRKEDKVCLESNLKEKIYFTEFEQFGCKSKDKETFTPVEFTECVFASKVTYGLTKETLKGALFDCFENPKTKIYTKMLQVTSPKGFVCSFIKVNEALKLEDVVLGD